MSRSLVYACFFLSGFSGLVNEVVWSRLFVYTMGISDMHDERVKGLALAA